MTADEYLRSEEAAHDVARLLAEPDPKTRGTADTDCATWSAARRSAWRTVEIDPVRAGGGVSVYFRAEGDRYLVTDLGEACHALRLRTGLLHLPEQEIAGVAWRDEHDRSANITIGPGDVLRTFNPCTRGAEMNTVAAAALPRAIVAVMLAALRVASLETP